MQVEYSLDVVFGQAEDWRELNEEITRQAILSVRVSDMARFWGKRYSAAAEATSDFKTLVEGTRIKHQIGKQSIKMYDKAGYCAPKPPAMTSLTFATTARWFNVTGSANTRWLL